MLPHEFLHAQCLPKQMLTGDTTFGLVRGEQRQNERKILHVLYSRNKTMSTTEALRMHLDNVHRELHELQVENKRLRSQGEREVLEQLREEITVLRSIVFT